MDLVGAKAARAARMKAKRDRIRVESGAAPAVTEKNTKEVPSEEVKETTKSISSHTRTRGRKLEGGTTASKAKQEQ